MYADDTYLVGRIKSFTNNQKTDYNTISDNINKELNKISAWLKVSKLSLNASKCKYMILNKRNRVINYIYLKIEGTTIQQSNDFNFLGLTNTYNGNNIILRKLQINTPELLES